MMPHRRSLIVAVLLSALLITAAVTVMAATQTYSWSFLRYHHVDNDHPVPVNVDELVEWEFCSSGGGYNYVVLAPDDTIALSGTVLDLNCVSGYFIAAQSGTYNFNTIETISAENTHTVTVKVTNGEAEIAAALEAIATVQRPPDDRANWLGGDNIAAVYVRADANGSPALHIYEVDENSEGELLMVVTLVDVADYAENPPAQHLLIASGSGVQVFILNTGELQVNITEPATGKIFVTIYNLSTLEAVGGYVLEP